MVRLTRVLAPIWLAILIGFLWGFEFEGHIRMEALNNITVSIAHPYWLLFWLGLGLGYFGIPWFMGWLEKAEEFDRFFARLGSEILGRARIGFFKNLSRAYSTWRSRNPGSPENIDKLIEQSDFPSWLPLGRSQQLNRVAESEFNKTPPPLWRFMRDLYKEVDAYIRLREKNDNPLLFPEEIEEFHEARQRLSYFWNDTAIFVTRRFRLRYWNIEYYAQSEKDLLKVLCYLTIEMHLSINREGRGQAILDLGSIVFGTIKWGFMQSFWCPFLSSMENLKR